MKLSPLPDPSKSRFSSTEPQDQRPRPRLSFKPIGYAALAIATCLLLIWAFRPAPVQVDVSTVKRGDLQVTVDAEGKTRVRDRFTIAASVDGHLERIQLDEGDLVQVGTLVAQIDPLPLTADVKAALGQLAEWRAQRAGVATQRPKPETLAQANTRIKKARADQQQAEARVAAAQAALAQANRDRQRAQQLQSSGALARKDRESAELNEITRARELDAATLTAKAAAAEVEVAKATLAVLQKEQTDPDYLLRVYDARIASTEAELTKLRDEANRTDIRSPVNGRVLRILQKSAQYVTDGTPLLELGDVSNLELVIDVLSTDAEQIKPGHPILIERLNASPVHAKVRLVEPAAFTKVSALGVEEQRVNVIGDFVDAPAMYGDAYRVETKIVTWAGKNVLQVPLSALFRCHENWCVFTVKNDRAQRRSVTVNHRNDFAAEIQQGLTAGEGIILHPTEQISEGTRVAVAHRQ
ncbi:efflux RND transporter periplasmic adaptor subunit [Pantanalinema sp. GBBB05]|uniref:efflux RND transporter periplasmic adaptor subunit n=1 Tax=Pantanalinema sp. GBBB05 TaxID=2604139 RepID=UPI003D81AF26